MSESLFRRQEEASTEWEFSVTGGFVSFMDVLFLLKTRILGSDIMFCFLNFVGITQSTTELMADVHLALLMSMSVHKSM